MGNSEDPDQMQHFSASDLALHCLLRYDIRILRVNIVYRDGWKKQLKMCGKEIDLLNKDFI